MANDSSARILKNKRATRLSCCGKWESLVNGTRSVVSLGFPWGKPGNLKQCILLFHLTKWYVGKLHCLFRFVTSADLFERQFIHCNSALKTGVHWYLDNLRKGTLSSGPQDVSHRSRVLHSSRWKVQFPGGHDSPHGTDLEQQSKVHHCSHLRFPSCHTKAVKQKSLLCLPKKANLTEIRPQQR